MLSVENNGKKHSNLLSGYALVRQQSTGGAGRVTRGRPKMGDFRYHERFSRSNDLTLSGSPNTHIVDFSNDFEFINIVLSITLLIDNILVVRVESIAVVEQCNRRWIASSFDGTYPRPTGVVLRLFSE